MNQLPTQPPTYGDYQCLELLGQGGMGVVWLAQDTRSQELVALKTVHQPDATLLSRFRREIRMLRRLNHPGIVRWREDGVTAQGTPWYTMTLLRGRTLLWHIRQAATEDKNIKHTPSTRNIRPAQSREGHDSTHWLTRLSQLHTTAQLEALSQEHGAWTETHTAPGIIAHATNTSYETPQPTDRSWPNDILNQQLGWMGQVCQTLAFIHGEGVVHCDLKPENIFITEDGLAMLVDFGIADNVGARIEQEVLEAAGLQAGTTHYISPEQIQGQWVDARTDLYSLGCILYEVLTGNVPYRDKDPSRVLRQHLSAPIPSARKVVDDLPEGLDQLVVRLLAKDPLHRIGHAQIVLSALNQQNLNIPTWPNAPRTHPYLYRPRFTGRHSLLNELSDTLKKHVETHVETPDHITINTILLGGESGVGKSRLAAELIARHRHERVVIYHGQGQWLDQEQHVGHPLHVFKPMLRQLADVCHDAHEKTQDIFGPRGKLLHRFAPFLEGLPGQRHLPAPEPLPLAQTRLRLFDALASCLEVGAKNKPMLLVLDDLHWADRLSLSFIDYLISIRARRQNCMILGVYRTEDLPYQLALLKQNDHIQTKRLISLEHEEARQLIEQMLGMQHVPDVLLDFVYAQTEGNPYYIAEYLRLMLDESLLGLDQDGLWALKPLEERIHIEHLHVPAAIRDLVQDRLTRLPAGAQQLCQAASVLGRTTSLDTLKHVVDLKQDELLNWLEVLQRREILELDKKKVRFKHDKLREAATQSLDSDAHQRLHLRAFRAYAQNTRKVPEMGRLGYHLEHANRPMLAYDHYIHDVSRALDGDALEVAGDLLNKALSIMPIPPSAIDHNARLDLIERTWMPIQDYVRAQEHLELLVNKAKEEDAPLLRAKTQNLLGEVYYMSGNLERAERVLNEAMARYEHFASGLGQADVLLNLARLDASRQQWSVAKQRCQDAYALYRKIKDIRGQARALQQQAEVSYNQGRIREAQSSYELALDFHERLKNKIGRAQMLTELGWMHWELGSFKQADKLAQQALHICQAIGYTKQEVRCLITLAGVCLERHKDEFTTQWLTLAQEKIHSVDDEVSLGELYLLQCKHHRTQHKTEQTLKALKQLRPLTRTSNPSRDAMEQIEWALYGVQIGDKNMQKRAHRNLEALIPSLNIPKRSRIMRAVQAYQRLYPLQK